MTKIWTIVTEKWRSLNEPIEDSAAGRARETCERLCLLEEFCRKASADVPRNLLALLLSLAEKANVVPSQAADPSLERLEAQRDALR